MDPRKIKTMQQAGKILGEVLEILINRINPGITEIQVDQLAEKLIKERGGKPGFKKVPGYKHTICISCNDVVVHGIPTEKVLKDGDVVGIDCGVYLNGYHTDMAETVIVGKKQVQTPTSKFLETGKTAMFEAIIQAKTGNRVGDISRAMQKIIEEGGYSVVRNLVGHGIGHQLHEEPEIPGYLSGKTENTPLLKPGMTIAIEAIYNMGKKEVVYAEDDDWTIVTEDGSISGLFERTVLITEKGPELLTCLSTDVL